MQMKVRSVAALAASCAITAASASAALAAGPPTVTTGAASSITATSAVLNGTITANGSATAWQFEYGTTPSTLKLSPVPAGSVGPAGTSVPVSTTVTGLTPNTTYAFTLLGSNATNLASYSYYGLFTAGKTLIFTTAKAPGKITLGSRKLKVKKRVVMVSLKCVSSATCKGKLSLSGKGKLSRHRHSKKFSCVKGKSFKIAAGKTGKVKARVSGKCLKALRVARHHKIKGTVQVTPSTGQPKLKKGVTISK